MSLWNCRLVSLLHINCQGVIAPRRKDENTGQMPSFLAGQTMCDKGKEVRQKEMEVKRETATKMGADIKYPGLPVSSMSLLFLFSPFRKDLAGNQIGNGGQSLSIQWDKMAAWNLKTLLLSPAEKNCHGTADRRMDMDYPQRAYVEGSR